MADAPSRVDHSGIRPKLTAAIATARAMTNPTATARPPVVSGRTAARST